MGILTDAQAAILVKYLKDVRLSREQQDRLIEKYWEANEQERCEIARAYAYLFSTKEFVDRLINCLDYRAQQQAGQLRQTDGKNSYHNGLSGGACGSCESGTPNVVMGGMECREGVQGSGSSSSRTGEMGCQKNGDYRGPAGDVSTRDGSDIVSPDSNASGGGFLSLPNASSSYSHQGTPHTTSSPTPPSSSNAASPFSSPVTPRTPNILAGGASSSRRIVQTEMRLRTAITDQFSKLSGPGPFEISFGLVRSEAERREVVDLFASQFEHPDPTEILRLVSLPQGCHTRTRRRISGGYTWFIRCLLTGEVVCAVHVMAHHFQTHHFVEMPLFATGAGYKNNGFGRLLNGALAAWCAEADFEFIMISADVNAIPFWSHLGYAPMSAKERKSIEFYYQHECYKFKGATPMLGYCGGVAGAHGGGRKGHAAQLAKEQFQNALHRMTKFVVVGPLGFEE